MEGYGEVVILSSNNYLGLSNHPDVVAASKAALDRYGAGTASVRFICGTFTVHRELEFALAKLSSTEAALSYVSCWAANTGAIPVLAAEGDVIVSDELNHASIIDGIRLSKAERMIYRHSDMVSLEEQLKKAAEIRGKDGTILIITDGVFSMEGDLARLPDILDLAKRYEAAIMVDDPTEQVLPAPQDGVPSNTGGWSGKSMSSPVPSVKPWEAPPAAMSLQARPWWTPSHSPPAPSSFPTPCRPQWRPEPWKPYIFWRAIRQFWPVSERIPGLCETG